VDRTAYESRLRNLHSWAGHLEATIESALPQTVVELGPAGDETMQDARNAAETLRDVARSLADVMNAYDVLLDSVDRPRRYDDFLQSMEIEPGSSGEPDDEDDEDDEETPAINRTRFARLAGELNYDVGWLLGAIHGALICRDEEHIDGHLDSLATGIEELMISYDRIQDLIGILPSRHCAFFDRMVVLEEEPRHRRRDR
jgi:hypothetical protein